MGEKPQSGLTITAGADSEVWGTYPNYQDRARYDYARLLWKNPRARKRLLAHWTSPEHPHAKRFEKNRKLIEEIISAEGSDLEIDLSLRSRQWSLRALAREIPPVFGDFY